MTKDALTEAAEAREELPHVVGLEAVEVAPQEFLEGDVEVRLEEQRIEEGLAELPVAHPWPSRPETLERPDVDEHGRGAAPLHVEGVAVLHGEAVVERGEEDLEVEHRRIAEHLEGPLIGIRDERDALVLEQQCPCADVDRRQLARFDFSGCHCLAVVDQAREEVRGGEPGPLGRRLLVEPAQDTVADVEDGCRRVTERPGLVIHRRCRVDG